MQVNLATSASSPTVLASMPRVARVDTFAVICRATGADPSAGSVATALLDARNAPSAVESTERAMRQMTLQRTSDWAVRHAVSPPPPARNAMRRASIEAYIEAQHALTTGAPADPVASAAAAPYRVLFRVDRRTPMQVAAGGFSPDAQSIDPALSRLDRHGLVCAVPTLAAADAQIAQFGESEHWYMYCIDVSMRHIEGATAAPSTTSRSVGIRADWERERVYLFDSNDPNELPPASEASNHLFGMPLLQAVCRHMPTPPAAPQCGADSCAAEAEQIRRDFQQQRDMIIAGLALQTGLVVGGPPHAGGSFPKILALLSRYVRMPVHAQDEELRAALRCATRAMTSFSSNGSAERLLEAMRMLHGVLVARQPEGARRGEVYDMRANVEICINQLTRSVEQIDTVDQAECAQQAHSAAPLRLGASPREAQASAASARAAAPQRAPDGALPEWLEAALEAVDGVPPVMGYELRTPQAIGRQHFAENRHRPRLILGAVFDHIGLATEQFPHGMVGRLQFRANTLLEFLDKTKAYPTHSARLGRGLWLLSNTLAAKAVLDAEAKYLDRFRRNITSLIAVFDSLQDLLGPEHRTMAASLLAQATEIDVAVHDGRMAFDRFNRAAAARASTTAPTRVDPGNDSGQARFARMRAAQHPGRGRLGALFEAVGTAVAGLHDAAADADALSARRQMSAQRDEAARQSEREHERTARTKRRHDDVCGEAADWSALGVLAAAAMGASRHAGTQSHSAALFAVPPLLPGSAPAAVAMRRPGDSGRGHREDSGQRRAQDSSHGRAQPVASSAAASAAHSLMPAAALPFTPPAASATAWRAPINTPARVIGLAGTSGASAGIEAPAQSALGGAIGGISRR